MRVGQVRKRDANEQAIVKALEACGAQVLRLGIQDAPDLLVRVAARGGGPPGVRIVTHPARLLLMEVKTTRGKLKAGQKAFAALWPETITIRSVDEALAAIGAIR